MKTLLMMICAPMLLLGAANGQEVVFKTDSASATTGNLLDGVGFAGIITNVVEIPGLMISARSGGTNQQINATSSSLGINADGADDTTDAFDAGETLILSFNNRVRIQRIDFNHLGSGEGFVIFVSGGDEINVAYNDLSNKTRGYFDTDIVVPVNADISFSAGDGSVIGMDGIILEVLPSLSVVSSNGVVSVEVNLDGVAPTNHVLQRMGSLTGSNGWQTVYVPFEVSTNWIIKTTNSAAFYRVVPE